MDSKNRRGVSIVISALIVTSLLLVLFAGLMSLQTRLHQAEVDAIKRESQKAMESFFQTYWLNNTHVRLFNNFSSVGVTLRYWIVSGPSLSIINLNPTDFSVSPTVFKDVKAPTPRNPSNIYKVVSESGNVFYVTDAPTEPFPLFKLLVDEKLVRPGFSSSSNGPLSSILLSTGPEFDGGQVTLTCVTVFPTPASCSGWNIAFSPSSPVSVPSGGAVVVNVFANIPSTTPTGNYFIRLRADTGGFVKDFVLHVVVGDFTVVVSPTSTTIRRGCAGTVTVSVTPTNYRGEISFLVVSVSPNDPRFNFALSPNPLDLGHGLNSISLLIYINFGTPVNVVRTVTIQADDGLGSSKTTSFNVFVADRGPSDPC